LPTSLPREGRAREETVEAEATPLDLESHSGNRTLWKFAIIPVLVVAVAAIGAYSRPGGSAANVSSWNNPSIAVLPFADMSPAKDQEYFLDGLSEQLINDLAKVSGLRVVGRPPITPYAMRSGPRVSEDQLRQASAPVTRALSAVFLAAQSGATLNIVTSKAVTPLQFLSPATFPRNTVIEAFGRMNVVCEPATTVVATGG
jgi:hypothetical protein